jgi:hypothetical protein
MHRPSRRIGTFLGAAALCTIGAPTVARADMVAEWNDQASTSIVAVAGQPPPVSVSRTGEFVRPAA